LRGQILGLLRADVLAREIDVFVQWHGVPFLKFRPPPGAKPFEPFGKARTL
jgi:hypothetical protein